VQGQLQQIRDLRAPCLHSPFRSGDVGLIVDFTGLKEGLELLSLRQECRDP